MFANRGPLRELGVQDGNLVLPLPDEVSGRYGRNKTPILIAPMDVAGMNIERFWEKGTEIFPSHRVDSQYVPGIAL